MTALSIGMIEVEGYSVALGVIDQMCKQTSIQIKGIDCNNPNNELTAKIPLVVQIIFQGYVSDVSEALIIGERVAKELLPRQDVVVSQLSKGAVGLDRLLKDGKVMPHYNYSEAELFASTAKFTKPQALCLVEIQNYTAALSLANELLQNYGLQYEHHEPNLGGRLLTFIFSGSESQVGEVVNNLKTSSLGKNKQPLMCVQVNKPTQELMRYVIKNKERQNG